MGHKSIGYHTRDDGQDSSRICGGSFGGSIDMETINRLVKAHFTVRIKNSGRAVFVDKEGRTVKVYIAVDPESTDAGKLALAEDRKERDKLQAIEDEKQAQIDELLSNLSPDEVIRRLKE